MTESSSAHHPQQALIRESGSSRQLVSDLVLGAGRWLRPAEEINTGRQSGLSRLRSNS
jgi:hypothetical protein